MAAVTKMAAAAKLAEERIRLDIGDDISVEDEVILVNRITHACWICRYPERHAPSRNVVLPATSMTCTSRGCVFQDVGIGHSTTGTQTDPISFDSRPGGRAPVGDSEAPSLGNNGDSSALRPR